MCCLAVRCDLSNWLKPTARTTGLRKRLRRGCIWGFGSATWIGCGSGFYIKHAAKNQGLSASACQGIRELRRLSAADHLLPGREPGGRSAEPMGCCDRDRREAAEAGRNCQAVAGRRLQECEEHSPDAWRGILCVQSDFSLNKN